MKCHDDTGLRFILKRSKGLSIPFFLRSKNSNAKKMDMSCIPGKIIGN